MTAADVFNQVVQVESKWINKSAGKLLRKISILAGFRDALDGRLEQVSAQLLSCHKLISDL